MLNHDQHPQRICQGPCKVPLKDGDFCTHPECIAQRLAAVPDPEYLLITDSIYRRGVFAGKVYGGARDGERLEVVG